MRNSPRLMRLNRTGAWKGFGSFPLDLFSNLQLKHYPRIIMNDKFNWVTTQKRSF